MNNNATALLDVTNLSHRSTGSGMLPDHRWFGPDKPTPGPDGTIAFGDIKRSHALHEKSPGFADGSMS